MSGRMMRWLLGAGCTAAVALSAPGVASAATTGDCPNSRSHPWNLTETSTAFDNKVDAKNTKYGKNDGFVCKRTLGNSIRLTQNSIAPGKGDSSCNSGQFCGTDTDGDGLTDAYENNHTYANGKTSTTDTDTDDDGRTDYQEVFPFLEYGSDPTVADTDGDGRNDGQEVNSDGTNPNDTDSDNDTFDDNQEHTANTGPNDPCDPSVTVGACDQDADGLTNAQEVDTNTVPTDSDSDDDGYSDGQEVQAYGSDPNDPCDPYAQAGPCDYDNDGLNSTEEAANNTDFNDADSDDDGIQDGAEVNPTGGKPATDPTDPDSDNDGLGDYTEVYGDTTTDPNDPDSDNDGRLDGAEVNNTDGGLSASNPNDADSDDDGRSDGNEVTSDDGGKANSDPSKGDTDGDQLSDGIEVNTYDTNPAKADTDNDGYGDALEIGAGTDPNSAASHPRPSRRAR